MCPLCKLNTLDHDGVCRSCGFDYSAVNWKLLALITLALLVAAVCLK